MIRSALDQIGTEAKHLKDEVDTFRELEQNTKTSTKDPDGV